MRSVCPECDSLNRAGNVYCRNCGAPMEGARLVRGAKRRTRESREEQPPWTAGPISPPLVETEEQKKKLPLALIVGAALIVSLCGIMAVVLLTTSPPGQESTVVGEVKATATYIETPATQLTSLPTDAPATAQVESPETDAAPSLSPSEGVEIVEIDMSPSLPVSATAGSAWLRPTDEMVMVYVPAGEFAMGMADNEIDAIVAECEDCEKRTFTDQQPRHTVYVDAYWIDKYEVANAQYRKCVLEGACQEAKMCQRGSRVPSPNESYEDASRADDPVVCVTWDDAQDYAAWVGGRLPTEAEWEKAARGTDGRRYPWGNEFECGKGNFDDETENDDDTVVCDEGSDGYMTTAPVGTFPGGASPYGALDMAGNVWEWVADWYDPFYYARSPTRNPLGPESGEAHVARGGSFISGVADSLWRMWFLPSESPDITGFRVVIPAEGEPEVSIQDLPGADQVVAYNPGRGVRAMYADPEALLGSPDLVADPCCQGVVHLGEWGTVLLAFTENSIIDGEGPDLLVFGELTSDEYVRVELSADGRTWTRSRRVTELPSPLDLAEVGLDQAIYVRLMNLEPTAITGAGLDAVVALNSEVGPGGELPRLPDAVARQDLTLRQEPLTLADEVVAVPAGAELTLLARTKNARWVKLETDDGQSGWSRAYRVGLNVDLDDAPVEPIPAQPDQTATPATPAAEEPRVKSSATPSPEP